MVADNLFIRRLVKITLIIGAASRFMIFAESVLIFGARSVALGTKPIN